MILKTFQLLCTTSDHDFAFADMYMLVQRNTTISEEMNITCFMITQACTVLLFK